MKRTVFFISDGTGITAANLGHSLLTQFENIEFEEITLPYINTVTKAMDAVRQIEDAYLRDKQKPLIFATLISPEIQTYIDKSPGLVMDFFKVFIDPLEKELNLKSSHTVGRTHGLRNYHDYMTRINAVNYTLSNDDGANIHDYDKADIVLVGISRCGKTPTCLYLALQFGLYAANYPLTGEELENMELPKFLKSVRSKIFGLTIEPDRLQSIRQERRPNSDYSSFKRCQRELKEAEIIFQKEKIPFLDTTYRSIEEIAAEIVSMTGVKKRLF